MIYHPAVKAAEKKHKAVDHIMVQHVDYLAPFAGMELPAIKVESGPGWEDLRVALFAGGLRRGPYTVSFVVQLPNGNLETKEVRVYGMTYASPNCAWVHVEGQFMSPIQISESPYGHFVAKYSPDRGLSRGKMTLLP